METQFYIVNVEAAIYSKDKYLIIKRSEKEEHAAGLLSMVGGKVDATTSEDTVLEKALKREILEEVGIEVNDTFNYVESKSFVSDKGQAVIDVVFLCSYKSGEPKCISKDEVSEVYWMTYEEIMTNSNTPPWIKASIEKAEIIRQSIGD